MAIENLEFLVHVSLVPDFDSPIVRTGGKQPAVNIPEIQNKSSKWCNGVEIISFPLSNDLYRPDTQHEWPTSLLLSWEMTCLLAPYQDVSETVLKPCIIGNINSCGIIHFYYPRMTPGLYFNRLLYSFTGPWYNTPGNHIGKCCTI